MTGTTQEMAGSQEGEAEEGGTQPMEDLVPEGQADPSWAKLMPIDVHFTACSLTESSTTFGRSDPAKPQAPKGHVFIGRPDWEFNAAISKYHFTIMTEPSANGGPANAFIVDTSSNGTYVNGDRLTKSVRRPLLPNAEIAIALARNRVFIFYVREEGKKYPEELRALYDITRELGRGAMGTVHRGFRKADGESVAVKEVQKNKFNPTSTKQLEREVEILKAIRHPACIAVENVVESPTATFIVMEIVEGGELFDRIVHHKRLPERIAKLYVVQMLEAIRYLHSEGIVHRDLKPENILLSHPEELECAVKVSDFGLSKMFDSESMMRTFCGTPNYLAPEIVQSGGHGTYTKAVDLWSLGVIAFVALSGYPPFSKDYKDLSLDRQITQGRLKWVESEWKGVSDQARQLVKGLMVVEPEERLSAAQALAHPWIADDQDVLRLAERIMFPNGRPDADAAAKANGDAAAEATSEGSGSQEEDFRAPSSQENGDGRVRKRGVKQTLPNEVMDVDARPSSQPKRPK